MAAKNISMNKAGALNGWFLALGILFVIFGFVIMLFPIAGTVTIELVFGLVLLFLGLSQIVLAFVAQKWTGFLFVFLSGIVSIILAVFLLFNLAAGVIILTLLLGIYLLIEGLIKIFGAFRLESEVNNGWLLFDGAITLLLGLLVILAWPTDSTWVMGLFFGIYLLFGGLSFIMLSQMRK
ncbi:MAG: DUF308 domain-containing protein [Candidatus Micrarchaeia archaeon]